MSIDYTSKIASRSLFLKCTHFGRKMGVATTAAPYGFWATNPTKKLAHWVYLLGQPLSRNRVFQNFSGEPPPPPLNREPHVALLLDGGWTTKSPADGNKSLSLPKSICSQEVVSSCLGKDLSTISGTDYSGRDHITVKYCFWITRLVKKHSYSVSELPDGLFCSRSQRTTTR